MDFSLAELLVIAIVALVCIGPKELPGVMRSVGRLVRLVRRQASEFMGQLETMDTPKTPSTHWIVGDDGKLYESYHPKVEEDTSLPSPVPAKRGHPLP
jgi:sec-independent protein translocase protein TatB